MLQFGWATASSGVTFRISSNSRSRKGPPLAVSMIRSIVSARSRSKHCQIALCSLSTGSRMAPHRATSSITRVAGADQYLLVRESDNGSTPDCSQGGRQPGGSDNSRHHPLRRTQRRLSERLGAASRFNPAARKRFFQRRVMRGVSDRRKSRPQGPSLLGQAMRVTVRRKRFDLETFGIAQQQVDGVLTNRSCRARKSSPVAPRRCGI